MRVRLKTARGRKSSSTRWLNRQLNDPYVQEARKLGYRSRAAFKLLELDDRFGILKSGQRVVDLGAAPGAWTQIAVEKIRPSESGGKVIAIDIQEMEPLVGANTFVLDICLPEASQKLLEALGSGADVILSDMAAAVTGHKSTDHLRTMALCEEAHALAVEALVPGGAMVMKAFAGGAHADLMSSIKKNFEKLRTVKPDASRPESPETYVVATGFRRREDIIP
ncbi:MAG: RlmE family RNA methyltransferase [Pseudomonadota bacterium]|nr:RlmE family RNA methyltransferase [Pseudomonadota bacterium]